MEINPLKQKQGKERYLTTEPEKPRMKPARAVGPRGGSRTSSMAGSRSYTSLPQGAWGWPKRATGNQFNGGKEANAARDYTSRSPMSQRDGGRGQEGPSSKKRAVQISNQRQEGARRNRGWKS